MKTTQHKFVTFTVCAALIASVALTISTSRAAGTKTWSGASSSDFEIGANWGGTAPANDLTTDVGTFSTGPTSNLPSLSASRSINGLLFSNSSGGWTFGSGSSSNVLTVGAGGIKGTNTSGTNTISANLGIGASQTFISGSSSTGGTLKFTGSISMGTSGSPVAQTLSLGDTSTTADGTITLDPSGSNSINLYGSNGASGVLAIVTGSAGTAKTVNFGSGANSTTSTNIISSSNGSGIKTVYGATLNVNSGTWITNAVGSNNSNVATGTITINGGTLKTGAGRYTISYGNSTSNGAGTLNVAGGAYIETNAGDVSSNSGYLAIGNAGQVGTSAVASMNVSAGFVDVATAQNSGSIGSLVIGQTLGTSSQSNTALYNQSGGVAQFGVTAASDVFTGGAPGSTTTNNGLLIGLTTNAQTGLNYTNTALTLTGGRLNVGGTITGTATVTAATGSIKNLNLMGGTLTAFGIDVTSLGSSATATAAANQVATSTNIGTLVNRGTTLSPGGQFISTSTDSYGNVTVTLTPVTGQTTITGNYSGTGAGTISIKLGGKTASTAFQDTGLGNFSNLAVSGTVSLNDTLSLSLLPGYAPTVNDTFKIITASSVSGTFVQGSTITTSSGGFDYNFGIGYNANDVTLTLNSITASAIPEPSTYAGLAGVMALVAAMVYRRRKMA